MNYRAIAIGAGVAMVATVGGFYFYRRSRALRILGDRNTSNALVTAKNEAEALKIKAAEEARAKAAAAQKGSGGGGISLKDFDPTSSKGKNTIGEIGKGAAAGAAVGSFVPVIGTAIGGAVGGIVGGLKGIFS
jgi:hypothetical protein